jgi:catechol 2,3-dioxygenase-like lactoylglutathione lyase family enzyme
MTGSKLRWPNWLGVVVDDLLAQRDFYRDVLGFEQLGSGEGWVQFDMGFPNVLELLQRSEDPQYDRPRYQVGYAVNDIRAAREELIARGATPISGIEGSAESNGYWAYFRDPEGNAFEISQRVGESWVQ